VGNRNFVVQYTIKAKNKFSGVADKFSQSAKKINNSVSSIKNAVRKGGVELDKFKAKLGGVGRKMRNFGAAATVGITLPVLFAVKSMIKSAANAEEARSKFNTIFSSISGEANSMAENLADSFNFSKIGAREALSFTGDILTGFGFAQKAALDMSNQVQELAADMGSLKNIDPKRVSEAITKALLGERESLKLLGVAILENDVKRRVNLMASKGARFESLKQAKAMATFQLITEQAKNSIGDLAKTKGSLTNRTRRLTAKFEDLTEAIGTRLLPLALKVVNVVISLIDKFTALSPVTQNIILGIVGFVAAMAPLMLIVGTAILMFTALNAAAMPAAIAIGSVVGVVLLAAGVFAAAWQLGSMLADKLKEMPGLWFAIGSAVDTVLEPIRFVAALIEGLIGTLGSLGALLGRSVAKLFSAGEAEISKRLELNQKSQTDVNLNVGLAGGLEQKGGASVTQTGRPANVGLNAAGA